MSELICRTLKLLAETKGGFLSAVKNIFNTRTMTTKISDLSVGDWVHHDFYELDMRVITIYGDNKRIIAESSSGYGVTCHLDHFNPIPITPEILEANGFVKNGEYNEWSRGNWDDIPFIGISLSRQSVRVKNLGTDIFLENKVVYVHQLQHALRLAGVDKEINLKAK